MQMAAFGVQDVHAASNWGALPGAEAPGGRAQRRNRPCAGSRQPGRPHGEAAGACQGHEWLTASCGPGGTTPVPNNIAVLA